MSNSNNNTCERCAEPLAGKQSRWCSLKCSKLGLKSAYRKRHRETLYNYKNNWRRAKNGGMRPHSRPAALRESTCLRCSARADLQLAHIKPIGVGGTHSHVITLCRKCHHQFDNLLRDYWYSALS